MDELNHDFQALALEGRVMGEVRVHITNILLPTFVFILSLFKKIFVASTAAPHRKEILGI